MEAAFDVIVCVFFFDTTSALKDCTKFRELSWADGFAEYVVHLKSITCKISKLIVS